MPVQPLNGFWAKLAWLNALIIVLLFAAPVAYAQTVNQYTVADNSPGGAIIDLSCNQPTSSQIVRTFAVPTNYAVRDVNLGVFLNHSYRSDLRIFLSSPGGSTVSILPWTTNAQSGDNLNDLFDDEAAAAITTHVAAAIDPLTPTPPPYSHSFRPANPFTVFDGQNANGTWTLRICDAVGTDVGNFQRADLYITQPVLNVAKSSSVVSDNISGLNPKAIPGSVVRYCLLMTNMDSIAMANIAPSDVLPANTVFVPGSMRSGTSCAGAVTLEDDNNSGADEGDPFGASIAGSTITGSAATLAAGASFALVFNVTVN
jgi:uncharacterized repeat protein (TIGR01451 family)